jgi:hypothetical protein
VKVLEKSTVDLQSQVEAWECDYSSITNRLQMIQEDLKKEQVIWESLEGVYKDLHCQLGATRMKWYRISSQQIIA